MVKLLKPDMFFPIQLLEQLSGPFSGILQAFSMVPFGELWQVKLKCNIGLKSDVNYNKIMPKDLEIEFGKVDPEARERAVHD